jgi:signal peptidase complex subunit 3
MSYRDISPANYTLKYNIMPWVGVLTYGEAARTIEPIPFPNAKDRVS